MKAIVLVCMLMIGVGSTYAQSVNDLSGNYELKDTLSTEKQDFGGVAILKHKVLHKALSLKADGSFTLEHLAPKGFAIDANIKGSWVVSDSVITLSYLMVDTDDNGREKQVQMEEKYKLQPNGSLLALPGGTGYLYRKL